MKKTFCDTVCVLGKLFWVKGLGFLMENECNRKKGVSVLVTSIGSVAGDITIKKLKRGRVTIVGCDIYPKEYVVDSYNVDRFYQVPRSADIEVFLAALRDICKENHIDYIIPLTDIDVDTLNAHREWFEGNGVRLCLSSDSALKIVRNKKRLQEFVQKNCTIIKHIPTRYVKDVLNRGELEWKYPLICKPYNGRSSQGLKIINSLIEWECVIKTADFSNYIVEPYIPGPVIVVDAIRDPKTNTFVGIPREELIATPHGCGTTVRIFKDEKLLSGIEELAVHLGVQGCVNFELKQSEDGEYYLIECNPRFSAGTEFSCLAGYDFVNNHLRCFTGENIASAVEYDTMIIARKYEEYIMQVSKTSGKNIPWGGVQLTHKYSLSCTFSKIEWRCAA